MYLNIFCRQRLQVQVRRYVLFSVQFPNSFIFQIISNGNDLIFKIFPPFKWVGHPVQTNNKSVHCALLLFVCLNRVHSHFQENSRVVSPFSLLLLHRAADQEGPEPVRESAGAVGSQQASQQGSHLRRLKGELRKNQGGLRRKSDFSQSELLRFYPPPRWGAVRRRART